ncbi:MAG: hypothetical protein U0401_02135 [Anaerolineae bacterium]
MKPAYSCLSVSSTNSDEARHSIEATIGFEAGADIVTVLGVANDVTVQGAINQARLSL